MLSYKKSISLSLGLFCCEATWASNPTYLSDSPFTPIEGPSKESGILTTVGSRDIYALREINPNHTFTTPVQRAKKPIITPTPAHQNKREAELEKQVADLQSRLREERAEHKKEKSHLHTTISWLSDINELLRNKALELRINLHECNQRIAELEAQLKQHQESLEEK